MNPLTRIAVLFGGQNSEYEVSLRSAAFVLKNLDPAQYEVLPVGITREGVWKLYSGSYEAIPADEWDTPETTRVLTVLPGHPKTPFAALCGERFEPIAVDVVYPVLHGKNGEDGTVQGMLQLCGVPYVGCGMDASAICMNKVLTHSVLDAAGVRTAKWIGCNRRTARDFETLEARVAAELSYPVFVKPARAGSSVGVSKARDAAELRRSLDMALAEDSLVVIEAMLLGQEVECAVLGNDDLHAATPAEIQSACEFYDYAAKYNDIGSEVLIPAHLSAEDTAKVQETAKRAYRALLCTGLSRVDVFVHEGVVTVNEINTLPGCTAISAYPQMMAYDGIDGPALCSRLVQLAMEAEH